MTKLALIVMAFFGALLVIALATREPGVPPAPGAAETVDLDPSGLAFARVLFEDDLYAYLAGDGASGFWAGRVHLGERVTASDFMRAYRENELRADERFKKKPVVISGRVRTVRKDAFDNAYIEIEAGGIVQSVRAELADEAGPLAASISPGEPVRLFCEGGTMIIGFPRVTSCLFDANIVDREAPRLDVEMRRIIRDPGSDAGVREQVVGSYLLGVAIGGNHRCTGLTGARLRDCLSALNLKEIRISDRFKAAYDNLGASVELPPLGL